MNMKLEKEIEKLKSLSELTTWEKGKLTGLTMALADRKTMEDDIDYQKHTNIVNLGILNSLRGENEEQKARIEELEGRLSNGCPCVEMQHIDETNDKIKALTEVVGRMKADIKHFDEQNRIHFGMYENWRKKAESSLTPADAKGIIEKQKEITYREGNRTLIDKHQLLYDINSFFKSKGVDLEANDNDG